MAEAFDAMGEWAAIMRGLLIQNDARASFEAAMPEPERSAWRAEQFD